MEFVRLAVAGLGRLDLVIEEPEVVHFPAAAA
jgi:hypothetical protein